MSGFTTEAQITSTHPLVDGGVKIAMHTKALTTEEKMEIIRYLNSPGWVLFRENEVKEEEIPTTDAELNQKTPGQRLRAVLFRCWEQLGKKDTFEEFYRIEMERFISYCKKKLT